MSERVKIFTPDKQYFRTTHFCLIRKSWLWGGGVLLEIQLFCSYSVGLHIICIIYIKNRCKEYCVGQDRSISGWIITMNYPLYLFDVVFSIHIIDHGNVQYHNQCGDDEEHVDISQFGNLSDLWNKYFDVLFSENVDRKCASYFSKAYKLHHVYVFCTKSTEILHISFNCVSFVNERTPLNFGGYGILSKIG